jgi:glycerol kinase
VDAYFSGTKIKHILDSTDGLRARAARGEVLFGTIDSFLIWRLTRGARHITDVTNASRTLLFNIHTMEWDDELLRILDVPREMLPEVRSSSEVYGETDPAIFGTPVPVAGIAGDQQAALFGQACFEPGAAKNTYGTGCFMLLNTGDAPVPSEKGLLTTVAWRVGGKTTYALEGAVFVAGAAVQWIRDGLKAIQSSAEVEALMQQVPDTDGVYLVPAFVGLGAPYWDPRARGIIVGLTRNSSIAHVARAAVDAMAYQTRDVLQVMQEEANLALTTLKVDGGAAANAMLLQFQADLLGVPVRRPVVAETTALGAAYLAGLAVGYWDGLDDVRRNWALDREFAPERSRAEMDHLYAGWTKAVSRSLAWAE